MSSQLRHLTTVKAKRYASTAESAAALAALTKPAFTAQVEAGDKVVVLTAGAEMTEGDLKGNRWARVTIAGEAGEPVLLPGFTAKR